ncbi:putative receptor-type tyrosine-protein phosphatase U [Sesbania bispinosa]|nr:putative receptor-type tyrosine-protein phosphatase U [Sesbania bispinosa]
MAGRVPTVVSALGASAIASVVGVLVAASCMPHVPLSRPHNHTYAGTPPGQPSCQELVEFIRLQDAMLSD